MLGRAVEKTILGMAICPFCDNQQDDKQLLEPMVIIFFFLMLRTQRIIKATFRPNYSSLDETWMVSQIILVQDLLLLRCYQL